MTDRFLYKMLDSVSDMGFLKGEVPAYLKDNLNNEDENAFKQSLYEVLEN